jgi:hypothetical protein
MQKKILVWSLLLFCISQVLATNLLKNADFKKLDSQGIPVAWKWSKTKNASFKIEQIKDKNILAFIIPKPRTSCRLKQKLALTKGKAYRLSYEVKTKSLGACSIHVQWKTKRNAKEPQGYLPAVQFCSKYSWKRFNRVFLYDEKKALLSGPELVIANASHGMMMFRNIQLVEVPKSELASQFRVDGWEKNPYTKIFSRKNKVIVELKCPKSKKKVQSNYASIELEPGREYRLNYAVKALDEGSRNDDGHHFRTFITWLGSHQRNNDLDDVVLETGIKYRRKVTFTVPIKTFSNQAVINCSTVSHGRIEFCDFKLTKLARVTPSAITISIDSPAYRGDLFSSRPIRQVRGKLSFPKNTATASLMLKNAKGKVLWSKNKSNLTTFEFPANFPVGTYYLHVLPFDASGKKLKPEKKRIRKLAKNSIEIIIDEAKNLRINGRLFMPLLAMHSCLSNIEQSFYYFARNGVNTITIDLPNEPKKLLKILELANDYKLKLIVGTEYPRSTAKADLDKWEKYHHKVFSKKVRDHNAFLMYSLVDEPQVQGIPLDVLQWTYKYLQNADPYRPVWINEAPLGGIKILKKYSQNADIYGVDVYPVPAPHPCNNLPNDREISCVGGYTRKMRKTVADKKPIYMVLQAFAWKDLHGKSGAVYPNYIQERFMAYYSIISGANALGFWGCAYVKDKDYISKVLAPVWRECAKMAAVFTAPTWEKCKPKSTASLIHFTTRKINGNKFIIAANASKKVISTTIILNGVKQLSKLKVLQENREVRLKDNSFSDHFGAYEVHVYAVSDLPAMLHPFLPVNNKLETDNSPINAYLGRRVMSNANWLVTHYTEKTNRNLIRRKFDVKGDLKSASLKVELNDIGAIYVNGVFLAKTLKGSLVKNYELAKHLRQGRNTISFELKDNGVPRGLKAQLLLEYKDQPTPQDITVDYQWN